MNARRELLRNGEKYIAALSGADYCLSGDDNGAGAVSAIREAEEALRGIRTLSDELGELYKRLESIRCEVYDLAETIRDKRAEFAFSPAELDAAEARTDQLYRLKKKYGATVEDMIAYLEQCRSELDAMETADDTLARLEQQLRAAEKNVRAAGAELTKVRRGTDPKTESGCPSAGAANSVGTTGSGHEQSSLCYRIHGKRACRRRLRRDPVPDVRQRGRGPAAHR